jgi:hypothetical protein
MGASTMTINKPLAIEVGLCLILGWIFGALWPAEIQKYGMLGAILLEIAAMAFIVLLVSLDREHPT